MKGFLGSLSDVFGILVAMFTTPDGVSSSLILCLLGFVTPFRFAYYVPSQAAQERDDKLQRDTFHYLFSYRQSGTFLELGDHPRAVPLDC